MQVLYLDCSVIHQNSVPDGLAVVKCMVMKYKYIRKLFYCNVFIL